MKNRIEVNRREFVASLGLSSLALLTGAAAFAKAVETQGISIGGLGARGLQYLDLLQSGSYLRVEEVAERGSTRGRFEGARRRLTVDELRLSRNTPYVIAAASAKADHALIQRAQMRGVKSLWDVPNPEAFRDLASRGEVISGFQGVATSAELMEGPPDARAISIEAVRGIERDSGESDWKEACREGLAAVGGVLDSLCPGVPLESLPWSRASVSKGLRLSTFLRSSNDAPEIALSFEVGPRWRRSRRPSLAVERAGPSSRLRQNATPSSLVAMDVVALTHVIDPSRSIRMANVWHQAGLVARELLG